MKNIILGLFLSLCAVVCSAQVNGAPGRVTGNTGSHGNFVFASGGHTITCSSGCSASPYSSLTFSPTSQVVSGNLTFSSSHDDSGSIGGSTGGGSGLFQVSCDGGSSWITIDGGSATLPTTSMTWTYNTPSCTGPTNLNTLQFRMVVSGGGDASFNMSASSPSNVTITW
jgi:hypothetical protein